MGLLIDELSREIRRLDHQIDEVTGSSTSPKNVKVVEDLASKIEIIKSEIVTLENIKADTTRKIIERVDFLIGKNCFVDQGRELKKAMLG